MKPKPFFSSSFYSTLLTNPTLLHARTAHGHMLKSGHAPPPFLATRLVAVYAKCAADDARRLVRELDGAGVVGWTAVLSGLARLGRGKEAVEVFVEMIERGILPNEFTSSAALSACSNVSMLFSGRQIHTLILKIGLQSNIFVGSSLLDMYSKCGHICEARNIFNNMPDRDVVSCTAIISGYAQLGLDEEALELFRLMLKEGRDCNHVTFTSILTAVAGLSALDYGRQLHCVTIRRELFSQVVLQNSLIDMYCKCGSLVYSRRIFEQMPQKTVVSWNSVLVGYAKHGLGKEVTGLFEMMKERGVKPDNITFMAVLSGCSHAGLVDEGLNYFDSMVSLYNIKPEVEHYACVVDLLGRAGKTEKALEFIKKMPFKPTSSIWGSLLGACRFHGNVSVADSVAENLFQVDPEDASHYVSLSNIYAASGRWEDVFNVRKLMKGKGAIKETGSSWIVLGKMLHSFQANDQFHPERQGIYTKLAEVYTKVCAVGYNPDCSCVLHDVDEEQKQQLLLGHSEKLAIALGLIKTRPEEPIRVMKNLRVCVDCHNFAKFVSMVYEKEISLRDSKRFHHIKAGTCSCGDYW